jgi:hypothetical protein
MDDENTTTNGQKCNMDSVADLSIFNEEALINCRYYFPNVTRLKTSYRTFTEQIYSTYDVTFNAMRSTGGTHHTLITSNRVECVNHIVPLEKLTRLDIALSRSHFSDLIKILQYASNIHTFNIEFSQDYNRDSILFEQTESFRLVSKTSKIKKMKITSSEKLETIKFLVMLCPRLKHLMVSLPLENFILGPQFENFTMRGDEDSLKTLLKFLLSKDNNTMRDLSSLIIKDDRIEIVKTFIESKKLHDISIIKLKTDDSSIIYLWW